MANLIVALNQLRQERKQAQNQIEKLDQAIVVIQGMVGRTNTRGRRSLSAAARKRISEAQRARWAKARRGTSVPGRAKASTRRPLSVAARRRIAAAQKARWARFRTKQLKAAA